jgi:hypothetical protein
MEKIRLNNGAEFNLIPMGICTKGNIRIYKFISEIPYADILSEVSNPLNISKIDHILSDNTIGTTYADGVTYKSLTFMPNVAIEDNVISDIYVVCISIDAVENALQSLGAEVDNIVNAIVMMSIL